MYNVSLDKIFICVMTLRKWMGVELFCLISLQDDGWRMQIRVELAPPPTLFPVQAWTKLYVTLLAAHQRPTARAPHIDIIKNHKISPAAKTGVYWNPKHSITITSKGQLGNGDFTFSALSAKKVIKNAYKRTIIENSLTIGTNVRR